MSTSANSGSSAQAARRKGALNRFRVMANVMGVMSLLLWFVYLPIKIAAHNGDVAAGIRLIGMVHGFAYIIYVIITFGYCFQIRKPLLTTLLYMAAGTLPIASFIADRKAVAQYDAFVAGLSSSK